MNEVSSFWSTVVTVLAFITLGISFFLLCWAPLVKIPVQPDSTTGHVWAHGVLREGVQPLPIWWRYVSFAAFAIAAIYLLLYPGLGNFRGVLGWTSEQVLQEQQTAVEQTRLADLSTRLHGKPLADLAKDRNIVRAGRALFIDNCAACHGTSATGVQAMGAPNLIDNDWLYGGDDEALLTSILDGRQGLMPPQGGALAPAEITNLANYVLSLSGPPVDAVKAALGKSSFGLCAACHGPTGKGNHALGAPNLTDRIWLHGDSLDQVEKVIREGTGGVMPAWRDRLGEDNVRMIGAWLHARAAGTGGSGR